MRERGKNSVGYLPSGIEKKTLTVLLPWGTGLGVSERAPREDKCGGTHLGSGRWGAKKASTARVSRFRGGRDLKGKEGDPRTLMEEL